MKVIIPLAGPDFVRNNGSTKAEISYCNDDLLHHILKRRPWYKYVMTTDYIFLLQDKVETRRLAKEKLEVWFPQCKVIFLSNTTGGAAFTATASLAYIVDVDETIIFDLADIDYELSKTVIPEIQSLNKKNAIALTFQSNNPVYSYLHFDKSGSFIEAKEKKVISSVASAGTYIFGGVHSFLCAMKYALNNKSTQLHNDLLYLCPLFNGVKSSGGIVTKIDVTNVVDVKVED